MSELAAVIGIAAALSVGTISPGPSFIMIARTAVSSSRANGVAAAFGMGLGGVVFAIAALAGLNSVLIAVPSLYFVLKVAGGLYLVYLGIRIALSSGNSAMPQSMERTKQQPLARALLAGFVTQISNPKTSIVYASIFMAFMPSTMSVSAGLMIVAAVFVIETGWYAIVALALSAQHPRAIYSRWSRWIDRVAGGVLVCLGLKLMLTQAR